MVKSQNSLTAKWRAMREQIVETAGAMRSLALAILLLTLVPMRVCADNVSTFDFHLPPKTYGAVGGVVGI